jgi:hypothetical protein
MRLEPLLLVFLAACQSAPPAPVPPSPLVAMAPTLELQEKALRQQQQLRAMMAQNDALRTRVRTLENPPPAAVPPAEPPSVPETKPEDRVAMLAPNAEGMIDLVAAAKTPAADEVNPFAVRSQPGDAGREVSLHVSGLILGKNPCALVNGRPLEPNEAIEGLVLIRIIEGAAIFQHGSHLLRLPVAEKPVKIRLPL